MPKAENSPPFPNSPGRWLECYRHRVSTPDGSTLSPESLGYLIGVSGATVRRWEADRSRPQPSDLQRVMTICDLSKLESEFLVRAFTINRDERKPEEEQFRRWATVTLSVELPIVVLDSLFFIRAWNSHYDAFSPGWKPVETAAHIFDVFGENVLQSESDLAFELLLREFWWSTAPLCGSRAYITTLAHLCKRPGFEEKWRRLALTFSEDAHSPVGLPHLLHCRNAGEYRVFIRPMTLPPTYHVRTYLPLAGEGKQRLDASTGSPPALRFTPNWHWSDDLWYAQGSD